MKKIKITNFSSLAKMLLSVTAVAGMLTANVLPVSADVIYIPQNSFYQKHSDDCYSLGNGGEEYITNGYGGEVITYSNPTKKNSVVGSISNGEEVYIDYVYTDKNGIEWGMTGNEEWVPMDYLYLPYSVTDFEEACSDEFVTTDDVIFVDMAQRQLIDGNYFYLYEYPGARYGEYAETDLTATEDNPEEGITYNTYYIDPYGYCWIRTNAFCFFNGYYDYNEGWMAIDYPAASYEELYPDGQNFSGVAEAPDEPTVEIIPGGSSNGSTEDNSDGNSDNKNNNANESSVSAIVIVAVIIAVIIIITVVILLIVLKNAKNKKGSKT